ncbi:hypothetical protein [Chitinimonas taiwanensis]|uniref:MORN repeat-containing protein n=1 Tax=Chitinimonas taiwanensis DSM 18899 TaxID=1121279 RepID=A0A1K2H8V2_9NEIS|nr:hypothetical protein [Chitinimonas taiwanensis]SFZ73222.1 MORN repeat-containing protein [Chitinimonas taiwanensis DSM 18899]
MKPIWMIATVMVTICGLAQASCRVLDPELQGRYEGACNGAGLADGFGEAQGPVSSYTGYFENGKKHGQGIKTWHKTGDQYHGEFRGDYREGWGSYTWGSQSPWAGQNHEGEYLKDLREGFGVYFWPNGDKFSGQWKAGLRYGESYMEVRKKLATKLIMTSISLNQTVCTVTKEGIGTSRLIRAMVTNVAKTDITLLIEEDGKTTKKLITDQQFGQDWQPC